MFSYKIVFGACLLLLLVVHAVLAAALKRDDQSQARVLHLFRLGLSLSAISYLLRITEAPSTNHSLPNHTSILVVSTCLLGTVFLWLGWMEHWKLRVERLNICPLPCDEENESVPEALLTAFPAAGLPPMTARMQKVLLHAQYEAYRRHEFCVGTDHLLLGLLHDPSSAGVHLLETQGTSPEKVHLELLPRMVPCRKFTKRPRQTPDTLPQVKAEWLALTGRAEEVLALAAQEAHRFDKAWISTEHLLLGLVLVGKGKAAEVLFAEGITVDALRHAVIKAKNVALSREAMNRPRLQRR